LTQPLRSKNSTTALRIKALIMRLSVQGRAQRAV
jgi:hypothetical protein